MPPATSMDIIDSVRTGLQVTTCDNCSNTLSILSVGGLFTALEAGNPLSSKAKTAGIKVRERIIFDTTLIDARTPKLRTGGTSESSREPKPITVVSTQYTRAFPEVSIVFFADCTGSLPSFLSSSYLV